MRKNDESFRFAWTSAAQTLIRNGDDEYLHNIAAESVGTQVWSNQTLPRRYTWRRSSPDLKII